MNWGVFTVYSAGCVLFFCQKSAASSAFCADIMEKVVRCTLPCLISITILDTLAVMVMCAVLSPV